MRHLLLVFLVGCTDGGEDVPPTCSDSRSESLTYVVSALTFSRIDSGVVDGFDIDGVDGACGKPDRVAPDGRTSIDNGFAGIVPVLETTEASAAESLIAQSISSGELLLTLTLSDTDTWFGDDCVDVTLGRAEGVPLTGPDGRLLPDQTLVRHSSIASVSSMGSSAERQVEAGGLVFNLPMDILNAELDFEVSEGRVRVQKRYDGALTGALGGLLPIRQIVEILERPDVNLQDFIPLIEATADVSTPEGTCDGLSFGFELEAIPVYLVDPA